MIEIEDFYVFLLLVVIIDLNSVHCFDIRGIIILLFYEGSENMKIRLYFSFHQVKLGRIYQVEQNIRSKNDTKVSRYKFPDSSI